MKHCCLTLLLISSYCISCKKQDDKPTAPTNTELLTANHWREVGHSSNTMAVGNNAGGNLYDLTLPCERDNFLSFTSDNTFITDEGNTKCSASAPQTRTDKWYFRSNDTQLIIALPDGSAIPRGPAVIYDIKTLSATTLALKRTEYGLQGQTVEEVTFTAF